MATSPKLTATCLLVITMAIQGLPGQVNANIAVLNQRLANVERAIAPVRSLMMRIANLERVNQAQAGALTTLATDTNAQIAELSRSNGEIRQQNAELQAMLGTFERFFGSLLVESPDSFDPTRHAVERMSSLNAFLGNREALLAALRPNPPTVISNDTVNQERLGVLLSELSEGNVDLKQKVTKLERRVDNAPAVAGDRSLTGGTDDILTLDQVSLSLQTMQAQLNALTTTQLDADTARRVSGSKDVISDRDREILEGSVYGTARGVSSVRKSVFSVGSTRATLGTTTSQNVPFNHVFVNKGNHWNATSNEFVAGITGYYFFFYSVRSYDGKYCGVTLLKNGEQVTSVFTEKSERNVMESQGVVIPLNIGDRVWLQMPGVTTFGMYSDSSKYTTFSGFLIYKGL